jgi:DNA mismatch repair protein MutL
MTAPDVRLAFLPHATSKIRSDDDLMRVATLGFRGEALSSIAAVSDVELWTCRRGERIGTHLRMRAGERIAAEEIGTAVGCRIEARDLFYNVPARRKFLKGAATEAGHVAQTLGRLALARPEIGFALRQDGREVLSLPPDDWRGRIRRVLGADVEKQLRPVAYDGQIRVSGLLTHPHVSVANTRQLLFFVNRRLVRDRLLQHAVLATFATLIPHGRYPAGVLFLEITPDAVDVNVHPAKLEVRFRDSQAVHEAIGRAVRSALRAPAPTAWSSPPHASEASALYEAEPARSAGSDGAAPLALVADGAARAATLPFAAPSAFAPLRVIGQAFDGYVICEGGGELVVIDQHAAHERVAFERLRGAWRERRIESQAMLVAEPIELGAGEAELLAGAAAELGACGLELEPFGERAVLVRAVPASLPPSSIGALVRAIASDLEDSAPSRALEARAERLLATIACHSVVRVGQKLSEAEMRALLAAMDSIDLNSNCPHGRPVARRLARRELEHRFGR